MMGYAMMPPGGQLSFAPKNVVCTEWLDGDAATAAMHTSAAAAAV
jgi:hypothetical protein